MRLAFVLIGFQLVFVGCQQKPVVLKVQSSPTLALRSEQELPPGPVNAVAELGDGSVAFGTRSGLVIWQGGQSTRYTGPDFEPLLRRDVAGNSSLPHNDVHALAVDGAGTLWVGTGRGLARLQNGVIEDVTSRLPTTGAQEEQRTIWREEGSGYVVGPALGHDVTCLYKCRDGSVAIGTRNAGLILYDPAADTFTLLHRKPEMNQWVTAMDEDAAGNLLVALFGLGVLVYDGKDVEMLPRDHFGVRGDQARALCVDKEDSVWLSSGEGLGVRKADGSVTVFHEADGVPGKHVWTICLAADGHLWVSTERGWGVWDGSRWRYPELIDVRPGWMIMSRGSGADYWVGGWHGAMRNPELVWHDDPPAVRALAEAKARVESTYPDVEEDETTARDRLGRAWISADDHVLRFDGREWSRVTSIESDAHASFIRADSRGRILIGTSGAGLYAFDGDEVTRYNNDPGHSKCVIYCMAESPDGTVYVGTQHGLYALRGENWEHLTNRFQVHPIAIDRTGRVWFGDFNYGLISYAQGTAEQAPAHSPAYGYRVEHLWVEEDGGVRMLGTKTSGTGLEHKVFECLGDEIRLIGDADEATLNRIRSR